jgi:hypothetical protein
MIVAKCFRGKGQGMNSSSTKRWAAKDAKSDPEQKEFRKADTRRDRRQGKKVDLDREMGDE